MARSLATGRLAARLGSVGQFALSRPGSSSASRPELSPVPQAPRLESSPGKSRLEAVLFVAGQPLSLRRLAQLANLQDATQARTLLAELKRTYDLRGCAFQVENLAGGYQLLTREKLAPWLEGLNPASDSSDRLSAPAMETLAVVAYHQPVLRVEIEAIRGVQCGELLRQLMERDLLRIVGRSQELGRPLMYGTTKRFLREFGLNHLDDLPLAGEIRPRELPNQPEADAQLATIPLADA